MTTIVENQTIQSEIVLTERVTTNEFRIVQIQENIQNRFVQVEVELGPFVTEERPNGESETRGSGRRGVTVWSGDAYDTVRDTWTNADLLTAVTAALNG
jgi:hypothetical protein